MKIPIIGILGTAQLETAPTKQENGSFVFRPHHIGAVGNSAYQIGEHIGAVRNSAYQTVERVETTQLETAPTKQER